MDCPSGGPRETQAIGRCGTKPAITIDKTIERIETDLNGLTDGVGITCTMKFGTRRALASLRMTRQEVAQDDTIGPHHDNDRYSPVFRSPRDASVRPHAATVHGS